MPLFVPRSSSQYWTYDNWGANPSTTIGASVVPGTSNAEGSWAALAGSANMVQQSVGVHLLVHSGAVAGSAKPQLMDVGVDPAGGTSYTSILTNIPVGCSPAPTVAGLRAFFFPIAIPANASVAARIQGASATAGTVRVAAKFFGQGTAPETLPVGSFSETVGTVTNSDGVSFTPGNAADGSWSDLGATTTPCWWWQYGYQINNATITAKYTYIELAWGDATNKHVMFRDMHGGTTNEVVGLLAGTSLTWMGGYHPVPVGAHIYIRGRCNNAPDTGYNALAIGVGG